MRKQFFLFIILSLAPLLNLVKSRLPRIYRGCRLSGLLCTLSLFVLCSPAVVFSQQKWTKTYGGTGYDEGHSVQQTTVGGYIIAGWTNSFGNSYQVYLIKTNASGDTLWTRVYGGTGNDYGYSVRQTTDGGYIVTGSTFSFHDTSWGDVYLIRTDSLGDTLWTKSYGGPYPDYGGSVQQTSDGGYIVAGGSFSSVAGYQVYLMKTNPSGDTLWTRTYRATGHDNIASGSSVQQTSDGGYIVAGETDSSMIYRSEVFLIKTNASGDTLWTKKYSGSGNDNRASGSSVQQTSDGGYIIAGETDSSRSKYQVYLIRTNALGDTLWTRTYGGVSIISSLGSSVHQTTDGGYIVAGSTFGAGGYDVYLIKTNTSGDTLWTKTYGGTGNDGGNSVQQTLDGGYIVAGYTTSFGAGGYDVYLIKTDANGNVGVEDKPFPCLTSHASRLTVTPNPFTFFATLPGHSSERFNLYDVSGRNVGTYLGNRIGEGLAAGVYFLRSANNKDKPLRIVKVR